MQVRATLLFGPMSALALLVVGGCNVIRIPDADVAFPATWAHGSEQIPVRAPSAMVATAADEATQVGLQVLRDGGNAVDAAVAAALALAVVYPEAGNLGGGGFIVFRPAEGGGAFALDFRERAPGAAFREMYLDSLGELTGESLRGHRASGVPGSVMGLWEAHQRFGTLPWAALVEPAVALAEGFEVSADLAESLGGAERRLGGYESSRLTFFPGGAAPGAGEIFRQPDLAATLGRVRDGGAEGFYRGETADLIVAEMARGGGLISLDDLAGYEAVWRDPVTFNYRGYTLYSMSPPSSGGATLALMAHMLEGYDVAALGWHSPREIHLLAEASKRAFADRNEALADPDYVEIPLERMVSPEHAAERAADISLDSATPSSAIGAALRVTEGSETTHLSVVDAAGNAVALTTTLNSLYGSGVTVGGAGFLLNNEMDDFAARPGFPNQFGLVQGEANAIEPGKRMLSAMTPTIVEDADGELFLVLGSPGGPTIITTVMQVLVNVIDFGMSLPQAVNAPRIHHQHLPDVIQYESGGLPPAVVDSLRALGQNVDERGGTSGNVQGIMVLSDGTRVGHSDPRGTGTSAGF
jgi:gamma-glutamyltranspeptidase/glutathione hydrolase